jgi:hypothetical protein
LRRSIFPLENSIDFLIQMESSGHRNEHRTIDESHRLRIVRVPRLPDSSDIIPCDFWMFGDFRGKPMDQHLQGSEETLEPFQELWDIVTLRMFKQYLNHGAIACIGSFSTGRIFYSMIHLHFGSVTHRENLGYFSSLSGHPLHDCRATDRSDTESTAYCERLEANRPRPAKL